jgi:hypothetical protein
MRPNLALLVSTSDVPVEEHYDELGGVITGITLQLCMFRGSPASAAVESNCSDYTAGAAVLIVVWRGCCRSVLRFIAPTANLTRLLA